ncbi:hypothetical protein ACWCP6_24460 [Streptomyces sp. NPDC002004]
MIQLPADFVHDMLGRVVASFTARDDTPAMRLLADDTGITYDIGTARPRSAIHGPQHALLAWLMGRTHGADLTVHGTSTLPKPPFLY